MEQNLQPNDVDTSGLAQLITDLRSRLWSRARKTSSQIMLGKIFIHIKNNL